MSFEIAAGGFGAIGPDRFKPRRIGGKHLLGIGVDAAGHRSNRGSIRSRLGKLEINPAPLLAAADQPRIAKDSDMARYARLALAEQLRQFADRQLHRPQQRQDAQPRRVGQRLEKRGKLEVPGHGLRI